MSSALPSSVVADLVRTLEGSVLDGPNLAAALGGPLDLAALLAQVELRDDRYVRVPLHVGAAFEVRLLCWQPGQSSAVHGHGTANGAMRILAGRGQERRLGLPDRDLGVGDILPIEPGVFHQVGNTGDTPLVTLHVYAPPLPVDQPSIGEGRRVVIVGGGWSGVAVAAQLLRRGESDLRITLVEQGTDLGRGVAYAAASSDPTLNVPAGRMGLDPAVPDDFLAYARSRGVAAEARSLLSRRLYGDYVLDRLSQAVAGSRAKLRLERGRVAQVRRVAEGWEVVLADGRPLAAEHVVLASGHGPANVPPAVRAVGVPTILGTDVLARPDLVAPGERVVLVGTGLTALDVIGTLVARGHATPLHVVSHTGGWPHAHLPTLTWSGEPVHVDGATLPSAPEALAAWFDATVADAHARGVPWQAVVDAVRPHIAGVWQRMSEDELTRFLRDHRPAWERLRHRAPAAQIESTRALEARGAVVRLRGTVLGGGSHGDAWRLTLGTAEAPVEVEVDRVIVCTGPSSDVRGFDGPWPGLLAAGHVQSDVHGLGVLAGTRGEILATDGSAHGLWAIGGLLRPRDFESTAVPELARQAAALGAAIAEALAGAVPG